MLQALGYVGISSLLPGFAIAASPYEAASDRSDVPAWLKQKIRGRKPGLNNTGDEEVAVAAGAVAVVPEGQIRSVRAVSSRLVFVGSLGDPTAEDSPPESGG